MENGNISAMLTKERLECLECGLALSRAVENWSCENNHQYPEFDGIPYVLKGSLKPTRLKPVKPGHSWAVLGSRRLWFGKLKHRRSVNKMSDRFDKDDTVNFSDFDYLCLSPSIVLSARMK